MTIEAFRRASTDDRYRRRPALLARTHPALEASLRVRSEVNMMKLPKSETKNETENVSGDRHLDSEELAEVIRRYSSSSPEELSAVIQYYFPDSPKDGLNFVRACLRISKGALRKALVNLRPADTIDGPFQPSGARNSRDSQHGIRATRRGRKQDQK
jgi:hypothetical protein